MIVLSSFMLVYLTKNTYVLLGIALAMNIFGALCMYFVYMPESIKFQLSNGNMINLDYDIRHICRVNGLSIEETHQVLDVAKTYMRVRM